MSILLIFIPNYYYSELKGLGISFISMYIFYKFFDLYIWRIFFTIDKIPRIHGTWEITLLDVECPEKNPVKAFIVIHQRLTSIKIDFFMKDPFINSEKIYEFELKNCVLTKKYNDIFQLCAINTHSALSIEIKEDIPLLSGNYIYLSIFCNKPYQFEMEFINHTTQLFNNFGECYQLFNKK
ncbi:hypothetical protein [Flavobacterium sp.]|uniref:hypothetical protein n=1 Tax=Flavobacterium sp. TaxID=239 RepID=UPI003F6A18E4